MFEKRHVWVKRIGKTIAMPRSEFGKSITGRSAMMISPLVRLIPRSGAVGLIYRTPMVPQKQQTHLVDRQVNVADDAVLPNVFSTFLSSTCAKLNLAKDAVSVSKSKVQRRVCASLIRSNTNARASPLTALIVLAFMIAADFCAKPRIAQIVDD